LLSLKKTALPLNLNKLYLPTKRTAEFQPSFYRLWGKIHGFCVKEIKFGKNIPKPLDGIANKG
jgi:hypothetical protein